MANELPPDDLKAAVDAGVIDAAQADKLRAMRRASSEPLGPDGEPSVLADEERFRFLNGFNDVFLTIGVLLIAGAFLFAATPAFAGGAWAGVMAFAAAMFWLLSEILVARLRAVLPGMVLAVLFAFFAAAAVAIAYYKQRLELGDWDVYQTLAIWRNPTLIFAVPALVASILYYWRFRLPFALTLIAVLGYVALCKLLEMVMGPVAWSNVGFLYGLVVLAIALFYDSRDLRRVTRLSDCAFWLHLVAAPLIVSPVISAVKAASGGAATSLFVLATVLALGLFALAIDRRALLVSSLLSFTIAVFDLFSSGGSLPQSGFVPTSFIMTLAFVGGFVLVLGVFWHPLRNGLLPVLNATPIGSYLPQARQ